jgi:glycosyltransferase involved in cell wall biosynthesis
MSRPRILIVGAFPPPSSRVVGGIVTDCRLLLETDFARRFEVITVDSTQISNPPPGLHVRAWRAFWRFLNYLWLLHQHRPAAVLLFASSGVSTLEKGTMAWCARLINTPALLLPRGKVDQSIGLRRFVLHGALRGATKVLCQGATWQHFAVHEVGFARHDAPVLPNWTARPELLGIGAERQYLSSQMVRLVFLGWLERTKGVLELLGACAKLKDQCAFELTLAGRGNLESEARALVEDQGLGDRVRFAGWLHGPEIDALLAASDVLVLPSWMEGLPNAMIEAMAAGLPVVVTTVGNICDFVTHDEDALLVPPKDVEALAAALARVITDAALRERLGRAGHAIARTVFSADAASEKLTREIQNLTGRA